MIKAHTMRARLIATAGAALIVMCAGLLTSAQPARAGTLVPISGAGSTWSYNAINQWISDVHQYGMTVTYNADGSSAGRQLFGQGTVNWGASEIPYGVADGTSNDPPPQRGYAYMPDTAGGTTFMYNLDIGNTRVTNLRLSGSTIAGIFTNKITMWNDPAIASDNPGLTLPAIRIVPVVRSDGSGATAEFTQWMLATQPSDWNAYCQAVGFNPCTQTSTYPVQSGSAMVGQPGDLGVSGYVSQAQADGAIGYVEFSYALETGFPVALVLNAAGYYTEPTPQNVAVSLLQAKINTDSSSPLYLTQDLSGVYTDTDPRTYELSSYSYMILPTNTSSSYPLSSDQGYTLGSFGSYLLCQGQQQVDQLGYSAVPINLVEDGYAQLQRIPGNEVPTATSSFIQNCNNPTFSTNGTNTLADDDPQPPACDKQGPTQCTSATGGASSTGANGPSGGTGATSASPSASAKASASSSSSSSAASSSASHGAGSSPGASSATSAGRTPGSTAAGSTAAGTTPGSTGSGLPGSSSTAGAGGTSSCDVNTGICTSSSSNPTSANGVPVSAGTNGTTPGQSANAVPVSAPNSLSDGAEIALMALAAALLVGVGLVPPLVAQGSSTRRRRRGPPPPYDPTDHR